MITIYIFVIFKSQLINVAIVSYVVIETNCNYEKSQ